MSPFVPLAIAWFAAVFLGFLDGRRRWTGLLGCAAILAVIATLGWLLGRVLTQGPLEAPTSGAVDLGISLRADALGLTYGLICAVSLLAALAWETLGRPTHRGFPSLVLWMATGLTGLFLTGDAFNFYVFYELTMISGFVLAGYGGQRTEVRNALNFAVVNTLGSLLFLGCVISLYRLGGTLDLLRLAERLGQTDPSPVMPLLAVILLVAFSLKSGLFPFHGWVPPVYSGSLPAIAAILGGAMANVGSFGLLRFGPSLFGAELEAGRSVLIALSVASVVYGSVLAVGCRRPSMMLAYSSVGQAGYVIGGLALGGVAGYAATLLYTLANSLDKTLLFLDLGHQEAFSRRAGALGLFSLAGFPPTVGFLGKAALFYAALAGGSLAFATAVLFGSGLTLLAAFQHYRPDEGRAERASVPLVLSGLVLTLGILAAWPVELAGTIGQILWSGRLGG